MSARDSAKSWLILNGICNPHYGCGSPYRASTYVDHRRAIFRGRPDAH